MLTYSKHFILNTETCNLGLGAVLYQMDQIGLDSILAYGSRTFSKSERNYLIYKLEFIALKWAVTDQFQEYLYRGNLMHILITIY